MCKVGTYKLFENMLECNVYCINCKHANNFPIDRFVNLLIGHATSSKNYIIVIILIEIL